MGSCRAVHPILRDDVERSTRTDHEPEMIILGRRWNTVSFVDEEGYDRWVLIRHNHITSIDAYDPVQTPPPPE
jgi:hypothetical protein